MALSGTGPVLPAKIGKYRVLERIGRGGMGLVFKAHDPLLDRPVALKVMSSEGEVTDELRARFFREAQACARLSHPHIVTVYDMGEDAGGLFIVMELLDGQDLRQLIAQGAALPLEDKLAIMMQVCEGLHYAHQKGIVHRDVKPGNILVQRDGQVKILDFGIARMATRDDGLTRTGLILGSLRYMAPEQIRGRADHRSDMFSVGAVFYEFLSSRPAFTGDDPIQLLEQLRADDPPSLPELIPGIPADVTAVVSRALRKDPAERFADLEEMRLHIGQVQRRCGEEARRIRDRLPEQRDALRELTTVLAERIGRGAEGETLPALPERMGIMELVTLERDLAQRIATARRLLAQADAIEPAVRRGAELLEAGLHADAVVELEAVVADMPEHARAGQLLERARGEHERSRRRELCVTLLGTARAALAESGYAFCLDLLGQAADIPAPPELAEEIAALRSAAESGLAAQETGRRARQQADAARARMADARRAADARGAPAHASGAWAEAEAGAARAEAAFTREVYAEAAEAFAAAAALFRRAETEAADASRLEDRSAVSRADERERVGISWVRGVLVVVTGFVVIGVAIVYWVTAPGPSPSRRASPAPSPVAPATARPEERSSAREATEPRQQTPPPGEEATAGIVRPSLPPRRDGEPRPAESADASVRAVGGPAEPGAGQRATDRGDSPSGEPAVTDRERDRPAPAIAAIPGRRAVDDAAASSARPARVRQDVEEARAGMAAARRAAEQVGAGFFASRRFAAARAREQDADTALARSDHASALRLLAEAQSEYRAAAEEAKREAEADRQIAPLRARVEQSRAAALARREQALAAAADRLAKGLLDEAEARHEEADGLARRRDFAAAAQAYQDAAERYAQATLRAQGARETR